MFQVDASRSGLLDGDNPCERSAKERYSGSQHSTYWNGCTIVDRLDELLVLTTIFDAGSLAAAARRLRRSPPAMTRSLAALEARVGARLVQRTTRRLMPTAAGRRLASSARQLLADYEQATQSGTEEKDAPLHGVLRVTAPSLFGRWHIAPLVSAFLDAHPDVAKSCVSLRRTLSYQVADDFASGALVRLLSEFEPPAWPVHLIIPTT